MKKVRLFFETAELAEDTEANWLAGPIRKSEADERALMLAAARTLRAGVPVYLAPLGSPATGQPQNPSKSGYSTI